MEAATSLKQHFLVVNHLFVSWLALAFRGKKRWGACSPRRRYVSWVAFMTALWISGATCVMTFGGGFVALRLQAYRGLVLAFCAGALVAGALMDVIPDALQLLESTQSRFHHHHLLFACSLGFLCGFSVRVEVSIGQNACPHEARRRGGSPNSMLSAATKIAKVQFFINQPPV